MCNPPPGPHHPNSFLLRAGLKPGIPAREAGALTETPKLERLFLRSGELGFTHSPYWHTSVTYVAASNNNQATFPPKLAENTQV